MIETKIYLYDSLQVDYKGTDYSANVLAGDSWADDLTETLDIAELTLVGLPFSEEFDPTTKFIVELWDTKVNPEAPYEVLSLAVAEDVVSQPILSDNNYFNHSISFNEASVISQGRIVDNCSETFKLKDVNINDETIYNTSAGAKLIKKPSATSDAICAYMETNSLVRHSETIRYKRKFSWVFTEEYLQPTDPNYGQASAWDNVKKYIPVSGGENIVLPIPLLATQFGAKDSTSYESHKNLCSVELNVYESSDGVEWAEMTGLSRTINPCSANTRENNWQADWRLAERINNAALTKGYGINRAYGLSGEMREYYKKFAEYDLSMSSRFVTIPLQSNKQYCVIVKPKFFTTTLQELGNYKEEHLGMTNRLYGDPTNMYYPESYAFSDAMFSIVSGYVRSANNSSQQIILPTIENDTGMPMLKMQFSTFVAGSNVSTFLKSAPALSAYDLFRDALLKSQTTYKERGVYIKDTPLAYYCNPNDIGTLQNTEIIESSFNQKNLWEILLEIGKYIHAIPYIEFGEDDRFVVKWRYLGQPEQFENKSQTISIFNSRSIENYVGALDSYVTNMVQRGAQIEEWVAPKSESNDYLVYNDVAVIKTEKPIIELLSLKFKCINDGIGYSKSSTIWDITDNVFEHNIYELLDVSASIIPNKGLGVYYNLGENIIRGLNYQLPSVNTGAGETEYAIKRIIGQNIMSGNPSGWKNIKINDFVFNVIYRTKEDVRSEQSRPDLRKYLINSKYENIPHHKQFNNQQDKMVDSVKFGNQVYGKLIKTGNTEYKTTEWNDNLYDLKKAGQLINIRGNIYYVARAEHTFFQDHIITEITYSKDYNKLSEIIGIPSEPRFFEISEQSNVDRQTLINLPLILTTRNTSVTRSITEAGCAYLKNLLFGTKAYPKYALTQFKNDIDNPDSTLGLAQFEKEFIHPISAYSMRNTLSLKWAMKDNFSAGDSVEDTTPPISTPIDSVYSKLIPQQYTDQYGRADLLDFVVIEDIDNTLLTKDTIKNFPKSPYRFFPSTEMLQDYGHGTSFGTLYYKNKRTDANYTEITLGTGYFEVNDSPNDGGDIVDSAYNSITNNGSDLYIGCYFVLDNGSKYALFAAIDYNPETYSLIFERVMVGDTYQDIQNLINKKSIEDLYNENRLLFLSDDIAFYISQEFGSNTHGLALVKDNRERIMINLNLQMLTDSDRFVLSGHLWQQNKDTVRVALLSEEVSKIVNNTIPSSIIVDTYTPIFSPHTSMISIKIGDVLSGVADLSNIKAIALVTDAHPAVGSNQETYFIVARNVDGLTDAEKRQDWSIGDINPTTDFKRQ